MWANTLGSWLSMSGGLGVTRDCNNFDPTDFVNNTDTGDWEYPVTRQQLINMFKRVDFVGKERSDPTTTTNPTTTLSRINTGGKIGMSLGNGGSDIFMQREFAS